MHLMVHLHDNREQNMLSVIYSYFEVLKCGNSVQKRPNDSRRRMCSHKIITLCWQPGFLHKIITSLHIWIFYCRLLSRENIFVHMWQLFCYFTCKQIIIRRVQDDYIVGTCVCLNDFTFYFMSDQILILCTQLSRRKRFNYLCSRGISVRHRNCFKI